MPLLFSLAIHNGLTEVERELLPGELLFAFLDVIYVVCSQATVRTVFNLLSVKLFDGAGIRLHAGKTRVWNKAGICPPNMGDLRPEVWNAEGIKILGTPVGSDAFVQAASEDRLEEERRVGGHSMGAGRSMWLANPLAVRSTPLSPLLEDSPSFTIRSVRPRP